MFHYICFLIRFIHFIVYIVLKLLPDDWEIVLVKKKKKNYIYIYIIWGYKNIIVTLNDYLLSCGGGSSDGGGGDGGDGGCGGCNCCLM